ncbi:MAG: hypothetical protein ACRC2T_18330, partial [Thermoguttaceae bacterium]
SSYSPCLGVAHVVVDETKWENYAWSYSQNPCPVAKKVRYACEEIRENGELVGCRQVGSPSYPNCDAGFANTPNIC